MSNFQIEEICKELKIKQFRGVFMRDQLNKNIVTGNKCLVLNIDHSENPGTHWTCLLIENGLPYYFDSYGFAPPLEIIQYCESGDYNSFPIQQPDEVICGHYCIYVLYKLSNGYKFYEILDELYRFNH